LPTTETGSRATGTGSSATDDVSSVILGNLIHDPEPAYFHYSCILHACHVGHNA